MGVLLCDLARWIVEGLFLPLLWVRLIDEDCLIDKWIPFRKESPSWMVWVRCGCAIGDVYGYWKCGQVIWIRIWPGKLEACQHHDIRNSLHNLGNTRVNFNSRASNSFADLLAKKGSAMAGDSVIWEVH
ncbi:hypothetical protein LWI28_020631 [Acer negundo]|uniref:Uncharacterized protein n=1 Tax=Acer negundo TaxID=4023 RepID=A0AAD5JKS6_ACENE|nr:hypothetical protein LWI28_020631 [Acer negundo]